MRKSSFSFRLVRIAMWIVPGVAVLGSACATELRNTALSATAFVLSEWVAAILTSLLPTPA